MYADPMNDWLGIAWVVMALALGYSLVRPRPEAESQRKGFTAGIGAIALVFVLGVRASATYTGIGNDAFGGFTASAMAWLGLVGLIVGTLANQRVKRTLGFGLQVFTVLAGLAFLFGADTWLLENSGYDFQVLLPGGVLGLFSMSGPIAWLGILAFAVTLAYAAFTPVVGGVLVLAFLALLACARVWLQRRRGNAASATQPHVAAALALVALFSLLIESSNGPGTGGTPDLASTAQAGPVQTTSNEIGGAEVRLLIWQSLKPFATFDVTPLGAGQFQAAYPPMRDPAEIGMSSANHTVRFVTEVEHPHNDTLYLLAEAGPIHAALWLLGLGLIAVWLVRNVVGASASDTAGADPNIAETLRVPLAAAALAIILAGAFHAPLFANPIMAPLGLCLIGCSLPRIRTQRSYFRFVGLVTLGLLVPLVNWRLHLVDALPLADVAPDQQRAEVTARNAAGSIAPELLSAYARQAAALESGAPQADQAAPSNSPDLSVFDARFLWSQVLVARPNNLEALIGAGLAALQTGDWRTAQAEFLQALQLDPAYPPLQRNVRRLGADLIVDGFLDAGLATLDALVRATPGNPPNKIVFDVHDPQHMAALAEEDTGSLATAWRVAATWLQARALFEQGSAMAARKELEQAAAQRQANDPVGGAMLIELAVLRSLAGDVAGARAELRGVAPDDFREWLREVPESLQTAARMLGPQ
jgi:tetratricopeptide (TPR) repeat protein